MSVKRFRTHPPWHRTRLWLLLSLIAIVVCLLFVSTLLVPTTLLLTLGVALIGLLVAVSIDRADTLLYLLESDRLVLVRGGRREELGLGQLIDANLLERSAARDYVLQRMRDLQERGVPAEVLKDVRRTFLRFCGVDIGTRFLSMGVATRLLERKPAGRNDLVLLRLRDGREMLLSPVRDQDMVDAIARQTLRPTTSQRQRA